MESLTRTPDRRAPRRVRRAPARERGIVVLIALIVMVALSLAAVGLMRSVDTASMVAGNVAFRQSTQAISTATIEKAIFDLIAPGGIDLKVHQLNRNYYAFWQNGDDGHGVPAELRGNLAAYPAQFQVLTDGAGNSARYVVERMCRDATSIGFDATPDRCEMIPPKQAPGTTANKPFGIVLPRIPYYRLTIRVDGPGNSVTFAQAMLR